MGVLTLSKVLFASCKDKKIKVEGATIDAEILSGGVESSEGALFLDKEKAVYIADTSPDLIEIITSLVEILNSIADISTAIDGATNAPSANAAAIAMLKTKVQQFQTKKDKLR